MCSSCVCVLCLCHKKAKVGWVFGWLFKSNDVCAMFCMTESNGHTQREKKGEKEKKTNFYLALDNKNSRSFFLSLASFWCCKNLRQVESKLCACDSQTTSTKKVCCSLVKSSSSSSKNRLIFHLILILLAAWCASEWKKSAADSYLLLLLLLLFSLTNERSRIETRAQDKKQQWY